MASKRPDESAPELQTMLRHWREEVPDDRLAHLITDVRRGMTRSLQVRLNAHGVAFGHWTFLRILWQKDGLTQRELSHRAGVMEPTTFTALKSMETLGYVVRRKLPDSRKKVYVFLTPFGLGLRDVLVPHAVRVNEIAVAGIAADDIETTRRTLLAMIANLAEQEKETGRTTRRPPMEAEDAASPPRPGVLSVGAPLSRLR